MLSGAIIAVVEEDWFYSSWSFVCSIAKAIALGHRMDCLGAQVYCGEPAQPSYSCTDSHALQLNHLLKNTPLRLDC